MDNQIINKIAKYFINLPIEKAWVFGSFARSEDNEMSDIDIMVRFLPNARISLLKYSRMKNDLEALTNKKVDLVEEGQLKESAKNSANREKVLIYERKAKRPREAKTHGRSD
ncbi:MAG: nucleotidyltransferase domain-containing protein [Bacteroidales bacterium]|nr:nucleotidyltransferase domain-containing protein [Bacteroidales bacterium]MCF8337316.1 nucleotidyltransferase domain-containing protein [Bacteroidales bacterium]